MDQVIYQLRVNQTVNTPNGPGVIQGRMVEDGETIILVAHDPNNPSVSSVVREKFIKRVWVLQRYPLAQITPIANGK